MNDILNSIELLIEQVNNKPSNTGAIIGQNAAAAILPAIGASILTRGAMKDAAISKLGASTKPLVNGMDAINTADMGATAGTSILGMAAAGAAKKVVQKYQEKKYGIIPPPDKRTAAQKTVDTGLNVAQRAVGIGTSVGTQAGIGAAANAVGLKAAAFTLGAGGSALGLLPIAASMYVGAKLTNKPIAAIQRKIQEKRQQSQQSHN